jgi:hypothetical protein
LDERRGAPIEWTLDDILPRRGRPLAVSADDDSSRAREQLGLRTGGFRIAGAGARCRTSRCGPNRVRRLSRRRSPSVSYGPSLDVHEDVLVNYGFVIERGPAV